MKLTELLDQIDQIEKHTRPGPWEPHPVNDSQLYATYVAGAEADPLEPEIAAVVSGFDAEFIALARTALPQLAKALRAVMEVHTPEEFSDHEGDGVMCNECMYDDGTFILYPCPTVEAITDALGDEHG